MLVGEVKIDVDKVEGGILACPLLEQPKHHLEKSSKEVSPRLVKGLELRWAFELIFHFEI